MDYLLPDEDTMNIMSREFAKLERPAKGRTAALADAHRANTQKQPAEQEISASDDDFTGRVVPCPTLLLLLYFVFVLGYNSGYGTKIYDADGGMGGLQSRKGTFGDLNNLFRRD